MSQEFTHIGFSDESNWNIGRFRSLGLVTTPKEHLGHLTHEMRQVLTDSGMTEFKWSKLKGARERFAAQKICDFAIKHACRGMLRIDVLIWDIQDRRHNVQGRDDVENLQRMYYHLFRNVLRMRWPNNAIWQLYPDEHTAMDWQTVEDCLSAASAHVEVESSLFTGGKFSLRLRREFAVEDIVQSASKNAPLLQVADLFAGLAVFSREKFREYQQWLQSISPQQYLFANALGLTNPSKKSASRFEVLKHFDEECKKRSLGVSLRTKQGLWTPNPNNLINFWLYEPQHPGDKAPTRGKRSRDV
jgi:hypothetical protein